MIVGNVEHEVRFRAGSRSQIVISWKGDTSSSSLEAQEFPLEYLNEDPELSLLDSESTIILRSYVVDDLVPSRVLAQDRHNLLGWGTTYLQRVLNINPLLPNNSPVYNKAVNLATAISLSYRARVTRSSLFSEWRENHGLESHDDGGHDDAIRVEA